MYKPPTPLVDFFIPILAILFVFIGVVIYGYIQFDRYDDCVSRGHAPGWCLSAQNVDVGK